ncbi:MAG: sigma-70 family RNA polymerase sigma factor [Planctomycetota bacterium]
MSNTAPESIFPESLLLHTEFLRRLVCGLVYEDRVDDVMQQTWLRAMQYPPRPEASIPGWLASVARTVVVRFAEEEARAHRGIEAVTEFAPSTDELVERIEAQTVVGQAVVALEPRYREVIILRYYEKLDQGQIAQRLEITDRTVRDRLREGLSELRRLLDERYFRDRRLAAAGNWCAGRAVAGDRSHVPRPGGGCDVHARRDAVGAAGSQPVRAGGAAGPGRSADRRAELAAHELPSPPAALPRASAAIQVRGADRSTLRTDRAAHGGGLPASLRAAIDRPTCARQTRRCRLCANASMRVLVDFPWTDAAAGADFGLPRWWGRRRCCWRRCKASMADRGRCTGGPSG